MSVFQASNVSSAMALTEEDLSAMLTVSNHPCQDLMSMSLTNAMISSNAMDLLSGQLPYSPQQRTHSIGGPGGSMNMNMNMSGIQRGGGLERSSMTSMGSGRSSSMSQASQWPMTSDHDKWELERKNDSVLDPGGLRASNVAGSFGASRMEAPLNQISRTQGLQRYHSAPSSFLQCLADVNEEAAFLSNSPLGSHSNDQSGRESDHGLKFFNENLAPIMETAPSRWGTKQPDPEKVAMVARSNPMNSTEQYFAIQAENARQAALRESSMASENMKSLSRSTSQGLVGGGLGGGAPEFRSRTLNSNLLRQSSSPAELLAALNERDSDDVTATLHQHQQQQQLRSHDDSSSGVAFGGLIGKRVRFPEEMTDDSDFLAEDGPFGQQNLQRGGRTSSSSLMRHQSLPTNTSGLLDPSGGMDMGYDDLLDLYAPCKTRARRGYATHPRSIAERNRRSRISERMKKLQDLVPNMDKQTNTADMLDEAVEYVKHLQLQVKDLSATIVQLKNNIRQQTAG